MIINIFIINDNLGVCEYGNEILKEDFDVNYAYMIEDAIICIKDFNYDIIISDIGFDNSDFSGYNLLEKIKESEKM